MDKNEATRILRAAGNWAEGMSDQSDGTMRLAVVLDISKLPQAQVAQVREALQVHAGGSSVKEGMGHPVTGTRKTIGLEAVPGNQGMNDVLKLTDGPLRGSLFRWDDDHRDWVRSHGHDVTLQQAGGARKEPIALARNSRIGKLWAVAGALAATAGAALFGAHGEKEQKPPPSAEMQRIAPPLEPLRIDPARPFNQLSAVREAPKAEPGITPLMQKTQPPQP